MSLKMKVLGAAAAALLLAGAAQAAAFQNGSFELTGTGGAGIAQVDPGETTITGWTVGGGGVHYVGSHWNGAAGSTYSLDLNISVDFDPGRISQTFDTIEGNIYTVTFSMAGNPDGRQTGSSAIKTMTVEATGGALETYTFDTTGHSAPSDLGWVTKQYTFTATGPSTTLTFTSLVLDTEYGPTLDNVEVTSVPPPPPPAGPTSVPTLSQLMLIALAGLLGLFGMFGRRFFGR